MKEYRVYVCLLCISASTSCLIHFLPKFYIFCLFALFFLFHLLHSVCFRFPLRATSLASSTTPILYNVFQTVFLLGAYIYIWTFIYHTDCSSYIVNIFKRCFCKLWTPRICICLQWCAASKSLVWGAGYGCVRWGGQTREWLQWVRHLGIFPMLAKSAWKGNSSESRFLSHAFFTDI